MAEQSSDRYRALAMLVLTVLFPAIVAAEPPPLDPAASHSRIVVIRAENNADQRPIVALANPTGTRDRADIQDTRQGILRRELMRQALLIAARDELGLTTRDEVLGDTIAANDLAASGSELVTVFHTAEGKPSPALIRRHDGPEVRTLFERDMADRDLAGPNRGAHAEIAEEWSRTVFPTALRELGLEGKPNAIRPDADLPAGVEDRLARLDYIGLFAAVRDLHEAMRVSGESPARMAALVRGYTLLGVLTEQHWHPAHKVFKARALLYAERLLARDPKSSDAIWHRAFAESLIGLHKAAQEDFVAARAQAKAENKANPAWADLVEAYAAYDIKRMIVDPGPLSALAALLRLMALEYPVMTDLTLVAAKDVLALEPDCYRAHDAMCHVGGVTNLHEATTAGPAILARELHRKLLALERLPAAVKAHLDNPDEDEQALWALLDKAGTADADVGEPSWAVVGRLIRETRFLQVFRRLHFMRLVWRVPVDRFWAESVASVADHPFRPYLETLVADRRASRQALDNLIEHIDMSNLELTAYPMLAAIFQSQHPQKLVSWEFGVQHFDDIAHDLNVVVEHTDGEARAAYAKRLLQTSPQSPYARAILIEHDWEQAKPHIAEWEKDANKSPAILAALARRYSALGRYGEAQHALTRYIRFSPDLWAYKQLADNFKAQGDIEHWQSTLEEFLAKTEDHGLTHANVNVQIANYYIERKQWELATRFAEAAATSGAGWAMLCAERCAEGRKDWAAAERYARQAAERYPDTAWARWFLFCKRTGHGDLASARAFAEQRFRAITEQQDADWPLAVGYFYWLGGDRQKAMTWFRKAHDSIPTAYSCFNLMLLGDEIGDADTRDEAVRILLKDFRRKNPRSCQIFDILRKSFTDKAKPVSVDLTAIDRILQTVPPEFQGMNNFPVGMYLKNHGKPEDARRYLKTAVESPGLNEWWQAIATEALRTLEDGKNAENSGGPAAKKTN